MRSRDDIDLGLVKLLTQLIDNDISNLMNNYCITTHDDLTLLDKEDVDTILCTEKATFMKRERLVSLVKFIQKGSVVLTIATTMKTVVNKL